MTDLASVGMAVDSSEVVAAIASLDKLTAAGGRCETAMKALGHTSATTATQEQASAAATTQNATATEALAAEIERLNRYTALLNGELQTEKSAVSQAIAEISRLTGANATLEASMNEQRSAIASLTDRLHDLEGAGSKAAGSHRALASSTGVASHELQNMGYQIVDIGQGLATGQPLLMVFLQQGAQIGQVYASSGATLGQWAKALGIATGVLKTVPTVNAAVAASATEAATATAALAAAEAGTVASSRAASAAAAETVTANTAIAESAEAAAAAESVALAPLGVVLLAIAAAAGTAYAAFSLLTFHLDREAQKNDYLSSLKLTSEELAKVQDQMKRTGGVGVSLGDVFRGVWATLDDRTHIAEVFGEIKKTIGDDLDQAASFVGRSVANIYGVTAGTIQTLTQLWPELPAAAEDAFLTTANAGISSVEAMLNGTIHAVNAGTSSIAHEINAIGAYMNSVLEAVHLPPVFGQLDDSFAHISDVTLPRLTNAARGTLGSIGDALSRNVAGATADAIRFETDATNAILAAHNAREKAAYGAANAEKALAAASREAAAAAIEETPASAQAASAYNARLNALHDLYGAADKATTSLQAMIDEQTFQNSLVGLNNEETARAVALHKMETDGTDALLARLPVASQAYKDLAAAKAAYVDFAADASKEGDFGQTNANAYLETLRQIDSQAQQTAQGLSTAFGTAGQAIGDVLTTITDAMGRQQAAYNAIGEAQARYGVNSVEAQHAASNAATASTAIQIHEYGDLAHAAEGFFGKKTAAYKVLQGVEMAYRALELVNSIRSIAQSSAETTAVVAQTSVQSAAYGTTAVARSAASVPFPFNLGAMGVVAAALAAIGVMVGGGGGGGGGAAAAPDVAGGLQSSAGTGSVLGDPTAKSESLAKALDEMTKGVNRDLEYSSEMVTALHSIDTHISSLTASLARELSIGGALDTSSLALGTTSKGGLFGGKSVTTDLSDQGLSLNAQTVASILAAGISGYLYQDLSTRTVKTGLFGSVKSDKTSTSTTTSALSAGLEDELTSVVSSLKGTVLTAATELGINGAEAAVNSFTVNIGKMSFKGLTGDEIEKQLNAVFGKVGDDLAAYAIPGLTTMEQTGEGALETLARVTREYELTNVQLGAIGVTFRSIGLSSISARDYLVQAAGGIDDFTSEINTFADDFLTEAQRIAPITDAVTTAMTALGYANVKTKDQFVSLVQGLDVSTTAGADLYAKLMDLAPAFAKAADYAQTLTDKLHDQAQAAYDATTTAEDTARRNLVAAYKEQASSMAAIVASLHSAADKLTEYRGSLSTGSAAALSPKAQYDAAAAAFKDVSARANSGDLTALNNLQSVSQAYLDASKGYYATSGHYFDDLATVKTELDKAAGVANTTASTDQKQLDALHDTISKLVSIDDNVITVGQAVVDLQKALTDKADAAYALAQYDSSYTATAAQALQQATEAGNALITLNNGALQALGLATTSQTTSTVGAITGAAQTQVTAQQASTAATNALAALQQGLAKSPTAGESAILLAAQAAVNATLADTAASGVFAGNIIGASNTALSALNGAVAAGATTTVGGINLLGNNLGVSFGSAIGGATATTSGALATQTAATARLQDLINQFNASSDANARASLAHDIAAARDDLAAVTGVTTATSKAATAIADAVTGGATGTTTAAAAQSALIAQLNALTTSYAATSDANAKTMIANQIAATAAQLSATTAGTSATVTAANNLSSSLAAVLNAGTATTSAALAAQTTAQKTLNDLIAAYNSTSDTNARAAIATAIQAAQAHANEAATALTEAQSLHASVTANATAALAAANTAASGTQTAITTTGAATVSALTGASQTATATTSKAIADAAAAEKAANDRYLAATSHLGELMTAQNSYASTLSETQSRGLSLAITAARSDVDNAKAALDEAHNLRTSLDATTTAVTVASATTATAIQAASSSSTSVTTSAINDAAALANRAAANYVHALNDLTTITTAYNGTSDANAKAALLQAISSGTADLQAQANLLKEAQNYHSALVLAAADQVLATNHVTDAVNKGTATASQALNGVNSAVSGGTTTVSAALGQTQDRLDKIHARLATIGQSQVDAANASGLLLDKIHGRLVDVYAGIGLDTATTSTALKAVNDNVALTAARGAAQIDLNGVKFDNLASILTAQTQTIRDVNAPGQSVAGVVNAIQTQTAVLRDQVAQLQQVAQNQNAQITQFAAASAAQDASSTLVIDRLDGINRSFNRFDVA